MGSRKRSPPALRPYGGIGFEDYTFDYTYAVAFNGIQQLLLRTGFS